MDETHESSNPPPGELAPRETPAPEFPQDYPPPSFAERVHTVFVGPDGLRAGWRVLVYVFLVAVLFLISQVILGSLRGLGFLRLMFLDKVLFVLEVALPAMFMAQMEQRPFGAYGLAPRGLLGRNFWLGLLWGIGAISFLILLLNLVGAYDHGGFALHGRRLAEFAIFWSAFFLLVGLSEEFLLRGYAQFTLTEAVGFWPAAVVLSLMFGGIHTGNQGESAMGILGAAAIGFFFCLTLRRTGNLWFAVGFHASWDWGESYLYSVPDSGSIAPGHLLHSSLHGSGWITGGTVGPEGSALLFVVMILTWIAFDRVYREAKYPG
jgi:membrane protease YdiL (CAAX protease family)